MPSRKVRVAPLDAFYEVVAFPSIAVTKAQAQGVACLFSETFAAEFSPGDGTNDRGPA